MADVKFGGAFVGLGGVQAVCAAGAVPGTFLPTYLRRRCWGLVPSPQVGSVLSGPGWNVHGDFVIFQLKKVRFEPGVFMKFL